MFKSKKFNIAEWWKKLNVKYSIGLSLPLLIVTTILYTLLQANIFRPGTLSRLLTSNFRTWLPVILVTIGQAIVLLGGGLDLSNGSIVSVGNVILALTVVSSDETGKNILMVLVVLGFGILAGFLNGFFTAYLGLQPVIITFATSYIYGGLALLLLPSPGGAIPRDYTNLYRNTSVFGLPISLLFIGVVIIIWAFFRKRKYGRFLYAVGGDANAAYTTGVPVTWMKIRIIQQRCGHDIGFCDRGCVGGCFNERRCWVCCRFCFRRHSSWKYPKHYLITATKFLVAYAG